tara:strand:- start:2228 stop:3091 length:864 start_codon:yes stop_codon:yes gene_type:complete
MPVNKWESTSSTDYSVASNWSAGTVPAAGENVVILNGTADITAGLSQLAVELAGFEVERGYNGTIGSSSGDLSLSLGSGDHFKFAGSGEAWINLDDSPCNVHVRQTFGAQDGYYGLNIRGTAIDKLNVYDGSVGIGNDRGDITSVASFHVGGPGAMLYIRSGCAVTSGITVQDGEVLLEGSTGGSGVQVRVNGGLFECRVDTGSGSTAINELIVTGGTAVHNSEAVITTARLHGGVLDLSRSAQNKTISNLYLEPGGSYIYHPASSAITHQESTQGGALFVNANQAM